MEKPKAIIAIGIKPGDAGDDSSDDLSDGVQVPEPKGWTWPDGSDSKEGEKFMCTVCAGPHGMLTIKDIDGLPLSDSDDDSDSSDENEDTPQTAMDVFKSGKSAALMK